MHISAQNKTGRGRQIDDDHNRRCARDPQSIVFTRGCKGKVEDDSEDCGSRLNTNTKARGVPRQNVATEGWR